MITKNWKPRFVYCKPKSLAFFKKATKRNYRRKIRILMKHYDVRQFNKLKPLTNWDLD